MSFWFSFLQIGVMTFFFILIGIQEFFKISLNRMNKNLQIEFWHFLKTKLGIIELPEDLCSSKFFSANKMSFIEILISDN